MSSNHNPDILFQLEAALHPNNPETNGADAQNEIIAPIFQIGLEKHSSNSQLVRDAIIGLADRFTLPFVLTAGLSSYFRPFINPD